MSEVKVEHAYLEYDGLTPKGGRSHKFWEAAWGMVNGVPFAVYRWGKVGSNGQSQLKTHADGRQGAVFTKIAEKEAKGYEAKAANTSVTLDTNDVLACLRNDDAKALWNLTDTAQSQPLNRHPSLGVADATGSGAKPSLIVEDELSDSPSLSERALALVTKAAVSPNEALAQYAIVRNEVDEERQKLCEAERSLRTLEVMLGIDDDEG